MPHSRYSRSDQLAIALACIAAIVAIFLFLAEKTPLSVGVLISLMVLLFIYPILHFVKGTTARAGVCTFVLILCLIFGWQEWPQPAQGMPTAISRSPENAGGPQTIVGIEVRNASAVNANHVGIENGTVGIVGARNKTVIKNSRVIGAQTGIDLRPSKEAEVEHTTVQSAPSLKHQ